MDTTTTTTLPAPTAGTDVETPENKNGIDLAALAATAARWTIGSMIWFVQYGMAIWLIAAYRFMVWSFAVLGWGVLAIFFPPLFIVLLIVRHQNRKADRRHRETLAAITKEDVVGEEPKFDWNGVFRPWALDWVLNR